VERLNDPVFRHRVLQLAADAALLAIAYYLAFKLRFIDEPEREGIPDTASF
jgi:hypothetical protein